MIFDKSYEQLERALRYIPVGSQTFSKSHLQYPEGCSPQFIERGDGSRVWDVDGNEYVDLVNGLMAVSLGYNDKDVNQSIVNQLSKGVTFSLPTELEYELAEKLVQIIPCAEKVRYGKNGTDATSAAVRLARAYTGRNKVAVCGYHGWQDWYIGSTPRHLGVPDDVRSMTVAVPYNDANALEDLLKTEEYAAFMIEPANVAEPDAGYLEAVREITERTGTILVFDEIVTGFHFALGGAQDYFGVTPDLAAFGKGMANGMPISAIVGKEFIMNMMDDIFFSGTFGGEALSLAASIATIKKMEREPVIEHLWQTGKNLREELAQILKDTNLQDHIGLVGYDFWRIMTFKDHGDVSGMALRTFIQKEMIAQGVLFLVSHNMSYAFTEDDHKLVMKAYKNTFEKLADYLEKGTLIQNMNCPVIEPIFQVRKA